MIIKSYKELKEYFKMFKRQNTDLLIVLSKAGLGKTSLLKEVMGKKDYVYINTHSTPLKTFLLLYENIDAPIVFDDISQILQNNIMVSMLKSVADTCPIKEVYYNTTSKLIGNAPNSFRTTSNSCLLLNEFDIKNKTIQPLIDRGIFIEFQPNKKEILSKIKEISKSQSIADSEKCVYQFIEENYEKIDNFSLRTYIKALQLFRDNQKKWKERFMQMIGFDEKLIEFLKLQEKYKTDKERIEHYKWSRATYYRIASEFRENE